MADTTLTALKTTKGRTKLALKGFTFTYDKPGSQKLIWKCSCWKSIKCRARIHTTDCTNSPKLITELGTHNHEPDPMNFEVRKTLNTIKASAANTTLPPNQLIAQNTASMSLASKGSLPLKHNIARCIRTVRSQESRSLHIPHRREDITLPESYQSIGNTSFLLHDSGPVSDRVLVFGTHQNLNFLQTCDVWMVDGTFKSSPALFDQLFVIHGYRNKTSFPLVFCLTPNRTTSTYQSIFKQLKLLNPGLAPKVIMSDYEKASRNAFHQEFPSSEGKGCFFHFRQCILRHIQGNRDIFHNYSHEAEYSLMLKHLVALAFLPPTDVIPLYERLMEEPFFVQNADTLIEFIQYFERTWIGTTMRRRKVPPMFDIDLWNCFHSVMEDLPKTNNSCEGFHHAFASILGASHPAIYKLIDGLKDQQALTELKIQQMIAGNLIPQKKKYIDLAKKLKDIVQGYPTELSDIEYLRRIAYLV